MIRSVRPLAVIVLTASTLALTTGCDEQPPVARGFGSRQLAHVRDTSFAFFGWQQDHVYFVTGRDDPGGAAPSYGDVDVTTGSVRDLGPAEPDLGPATPPGRYACTYSGMGTDTTMLTLSITDTQTGVATVIEGVNVARPYCPADDDPRIHVWLKGSDGLLTFWRGPYAALEQAALPFLVRTALLFTTKASLVQAAAPEAPAAFGLYRLDETELTVSEIVAPAPTTAAWADGATPVGSLVSNSIGQPLNFQSAGDGRYFYAREMSDGGQTLFLGPRATDAVNELALFRVEEPLSTRTPLIEPYNFRHDGLWPRRPAWLSNATIETLRVWHQAHAMITSCPWTGFVPYGLADPAGENIAFRSVTGSGSATTGPLLLVVPSAGAAAACRVLVDQDVAAVDFSPDGRAMYWLVQPTTGVLDAALWTAAANGSGARLLGSGLIGSGVIGDVAYGPAPRFVGDSQLELTLGGDLVWVDVHEDPATVHYIADHVFGSAISVGRWLISGHDYSDQDDAGKLALINRDNGDKRAISPAVAAYVTPDIPSDGRLRALPETIRVVYLVRGRNPSPQDGVWMATIPTAELQ
jgi:hypothetical protein